MLNNEDYKNILALIAKSQISGQDAITVAQLQLKINKLMQPDAKEETKPNKGKQDH